MRERFGEYLLAIQRGVTSVPPWRSWCVSHKQQLVATLGRQRFLQLKFDPRSQVPKMLEEMGIEHLDLAVLDRRLLRADADSWEDVESCHPAAKAYQEGDWKKGDDVLLGEARELYERVLKSDCTDIDAAQEFSEQVFEAVSMLQDGDVRLATGLLSVVASLDEQIDMIGANIDEARALLESVGGFHPKLNRPASQVPRLDEEDILPEAATLAAGLSWCRAAEPELKRYRVAIRAVLKRADALGLEAPELESLRERFRAASRD